MLLFRSTCLFIRTCSPKRNYERLLARGLIRVEVIHQLPVSYLKVALAFFSLNAEVVLIILIWTIILIQPILRPINRVKSGNNGIVMLTQSIFDICNPKCLNIHTVPSCLNSLHFVVSKHRRFYHRISTYQCTKSTFLTLMAWLRSLFLDSSTSSYISFSLACSK